MITIYTKNPLSKILKGKWFDETLTSIMGKL